MNKKLKKTLQCTMCAVLSFGMVVCNSSFVEAKKIKKQESVYVNAAADGSVSKITVSDWLKGSTGSSGLRKRSGGRCGTDVLQTLFALQYGMVSHPSTGTFTL